jgi:peptide/nickel transport system permease protein
MATTFEPEALATINPFREMAGELVRFFKGIARNKAGLVGFIVVVLIVLIEFVGPIFSPANPTNVQAIYLGPSLHHLLGTDSQGRDILLQMIDGGRPIITVGALSALMATFIAITLGSLSAYAGGAVDAIIMTAADIFLTIPAIVLLYVIAAFVRLNSSILVALLIAILSWPVLTRAIRSQVLSLREREYVEAARLLNLGTPRILFLEILPNMASYVVMNFVIGMTNAIYLLASLYLIGLAPFANDNWGIMINLAWTRGAIYFKGSFLYLLAPVLAISILQLSLVTMARSLEDIFNPRLRRG